MTTSTLPDLGIGPALPEHATFWSHCSRRELRFQRCADCSRWRHPPAPVCPQCGSAQVRWEPAPERAELFSYTVVHHPPSPRLAGSVPYNVAVVAFPELGDVRLVSNVIGTPPHALRIGMPLRLVWRSNDAGRVLPLFERDPTPEAT